MADVGDTGVSKGGTLPSKGLASMRRDTDKDAELSQAVRGSRYTQTVLPENTQRQTSPWDGIRGSGT